MISDNVEGYYFDRLRIVCRTTPDKLRTTLPLDKLKEECRAIRLGRAHPLARDFNSTIDLTAPTGECLWMLLDRESDLGGYFISYVEIAHDEFCDSEDRAESNADWRFKTCRKKFSCGFIFKSTGEKTAQQILKDQAGGLFAKGTYYSSFLDKKKEEDKSGTSERGKKKQKVGSKFKYVLYSRRSKINRDPCVHEEWRITSKGIILNKTDILSLRDLLTFDFKSFFIKMASRYIVHEKIDTLAYGRVLRGLDGRRPLTRRQLYQACCAANHYLAFDGIETFSDLKRRIKQWKKEIMHKRGVKSALEKRILRIRDFSRFILK